MVNKRDLLAKFSSASGLTRFLEAYPSTPSLLVINYHRIGDRESTKFDGGIFSCTADAFSEQISFLKTRFRNVNLNQALDIIHGRTSSTGSSFLITFDDGYRDNYDLAFPLLRLHNLSATFFLPTSFIGTGELPWWDIIAYIVKTSALTTITLSFPGFMHFDISPQHQANSIIRILQAFRHHSLTDTERFIAGLEVACGSCRPTVSDERIFLSWDEAREMQLNGMDFGSHTHTHPVLSKLCIADQLEELTTSRTILERELCRPILTVAYPVGGQGAFTPETQRAAAQAGYTSAFSFYSGTNRSEATKPYDVLRASIDSESQSLFRLRIASLAARGQVTV